MTFCSSNFLSSFRMPLNLFLWREVFYKYNKSVSNQELAKAWRIESNEIRKIIFSFIWLVATRRSFVYRTVIILLSSCRRTSFPADATRRDVSRRRRHSNAAKQLRYLRPRPSTSSNASDALCRASFARVKFVAIGVAGAGSVDVDVDVDDAVLSLSLS